MRGLPFTYLYFVCNIVLAINIDKILSTLAKSQIFKQIWRQTSVDISVLALDKFII